MVVPLEEFEKIREEKLKGKKIVATSMFFDPPHPGHVSCILESKKFGDVLVIIIDGDTRAANKKGKAFMPAIDRADIADALKGVDYVVIHEDPDAWHCADAIKIVRPDVFTKGGDRDEKNRNDPKSGLKWEADIIEGYGGRIEYGVGKDKVWSSSNYLEEWYQFRKSQEENSKEE
jgi:cytidyltransferase-like protein